MAEAVSGFQGEIAGLSLADVIQLKGHNRYSGCITVEYQDHRGAIYFVDGEIIHAEQASFSGEDAIYQILKWPGGNFSLAPEMTTNVCSIHCSLNFLLLEAHRRMDEENNEHSVESFADVIETSERRKEPRPVDAASPPQRTMSAAAARVMQIEAVTYAVLLDKQGHPIQDDSMEAEALAAKALFLAQSGNSLGNLLGLGELKSAAVQTQHFDLLMYDSKQHYLGIAVAAGIKLDAVETEIRTALVPGR
jgi:predicted regulator of Ras-like GTPase activity (Roadblock/LC7/MglB family)